MSLSKCRLYVIIDRAASGGRDLADVAAASIRGGADVLQFRDKTASARAFMKEAERLLSVARRADVPLIINDRVDIACAVGADGVHLGQDDLPLAAARRVLGPGRQIGRSTHSLEQARDAEAEGADYLGCGPIFQTPTKPDAGSVGTELIGRVMDAVRLPVVCIGGIDRGNLAAVLEAGADRVAVVRAVCAAADPESAARELKQTLEQFHARV
ncbi:MAG: thiamine phosphate synthase [Candidatus Omnitrophica bacterium]|nr:thiamine phosphate synthase [Candidatus Omnitrophota bacterium]